MMCATILRHKRPEEHGRLYRVFERAFDWVHAAYKTILTQALRHPLITLLITVVTLCLNVYYT